MDSLISYQVPVLLFFWRRTLDEKRYFYLTGVWGAIGLRMVISTNGTLIDFEKAEKIKALGISYVGISLDGLPKVNDAFRGVPGAYAKAMVTVFIYMNI
jgi:MoaA/NifB/PqqE/SkfB family radical SAM enzyme